MPTGITKTNVLRVPGRLAHTPTDLGIAFPHGGTAMGTTSRAALEITQSYTQVEAEEYGMAVDVIEGFSALRFVCVLREKNDAVISKVFGGRSSAGSSTSAQGVTWSTSYRVGNAMADTGLKIIWTPNNTAYPGLILYRAIPMLAQPVEVPFSSFAEWAFRVEFLAILDASGRRGMMRPLADLSL